MSQKVVPNTLIPCANGNVVHARKGNIQKKALWIFASVVSLSKSRRKKLGHYNMSDSGVYIKKIDKKNSFAFHY